MNLEMPSRNVSMSQMYEEIFEVAPNGMLMINSHRIIKYVNKKVEEIFGYRKEDLIGLEIEVLIPDEFKPQHPKFVENYLKEPTARSMGSGRELYGKHKNGNLIPVEIGLQPFFFEDEILIISSIVDITLRKNVENEIKNKTREIEEFSYRTSHDLKSPLKSIVAMADCGLENIEDNQYEDANANLQQIKFLSNKLITLVDTIMSLTKVEVKDDLKLEFNFEEYLDTFKEKYSFLIKENVVNVGITLSHDKNVIVQPARLAQILDNLISNSIKYCNKNLKDRNVELKTSNSQEVFIIKIIDNGIGIPKDRQVEVFEMFKRFHDSSIDGTGLGLYLVFKQAVKINAKISFESTSSGTTFCLEIPNNY